MDARPASSTPGAAIDSPSAPQPQAPSLRVIRLAAPAKLNLYLEILGRRDDGFHALETVFQTVDLHDTVAVGLEPGSGIALACSDRTLPTDSGNLAWRAAQAFLERRRLNGKVAIQLEKRVPSGAGLGGGSSDAAAVLRALNRLAPDPLPAPELHAIAATLGSDVPFFLVGGTAHALGRGEELTALPDLPRLAVTVMKPARDLPTPAVYKALSDTERGPRPAHGVAWWLEALRHLPAPPLENRMTSAAVRLEPQVTELLVHLRRLGVAHLMSGSGSACFALGHVEPPAGVRAWKTWFRPRARLDALD